MKNLFILFFSLISTISLCQPPQFSGIIHSKFQYFDSLDHEITNTAIGKKDLESHYYINSAGYKTINKKGAIVQIYSTKNNVYYFNQENEWKQISGSYEFPKLIRIEQLPGEDSIAGYKCKKIKIISSIGEAIFWYSLELKINKDNYSKHLFGNWYDYLKATNGGITLKYEMKMKGSKTISTAYKVDNIAFEDREFEFNK